MNYDVAVIHCYPACAVKALNMVGLYTLFAELKLYFICKSSCVGGGRSVGYNEIIRYNREVAYANYADVFRLL